MFDKMYRYLLLCCILSVMKCQVRSFEDYFDGPPPESPRYRDNFSPGFNGNEPYMEGRRNADVMRRSQSSSRVNIPEFSENGRGFTTVRNYITSSTARNSFNTSNNPGGKTNSKRKSQEFVQESRMVYPSEIENLQKVSSSPVEQIRSRNCSYGLCDEVDNYPLEKIQRILNRSSLKNFFSGDTIPTFESRFGDDSNVVNICSTITHTRFPKTAKNMQNKEQVIVNVDQYKQGISFETCKEEGPCSYVENFPNNFTPTCVQKYTVRKLMVLEKESEGAAFDDFKIPSCCVCVVKGKPV